MDYTYLRVDTNQDFLQGEIFLEATAQRQDEFQMNLTQVKIQYHILGLIENRIVPVLIDTGANFSHINENIVKETYKGDKIEFYNFESKIVTLEEKTRIILSLSGKQDFDIEIYVGKLPNELILGVDFLEKTDYCLTSDFIIINKILHKRYKNSEWEIKKYINGKQSRN